MFSSWPHHRHRTASHRVPRHAPPRPRRALPARGHRHRRAGRRRRRPRARPPGAGRADRARGSADDDGRGARDARAHPDRHAGGPPPQRRRRNHQRTTTAPMPTDRGLWTALRRGLASVRVRIVVGYLVLMAVGLAVAVLVTRQVQLARVDREIEQEQAQEIEELRRLATGVDPDTGEPFGADATAIFDTFLARNVPSDDEAFYALTTTGQFQSAAAPAAVRRPPARDVVAGHRTDGGDDRHHRRRRRRGAHAGRPAQLRRGRLRGLRRGQLPRRRPGRGRPGRARHHADRPGGPGAVDAPWPGPWPAGCFVRCAS